MSKIDEVLAKAKSAVKETKNLSGFSEIKGFKNYEFNGSILRNKKTKKLITQKKNKRFQIISDEGKNCDLSIDKLQSLIKNESKNYSDILSMDVFKKEKIVKLHLAGATNKEIEQLLGTNQGWIWNELNAYKKKTQS